MLDVKLNLLTGTPAQKQFAADAIARLKTIVNNPAFIVAVKNAQYSYCVLCEDNGAYTSVKGDKVAEIITAGKERLTKPDNSMDLLVTLAVLSKNTVGVVYPPNPLITTNVLFVDDWITNNDSLSLAAQWMHEWLHVAGFYHKSKKVDNRDLNYTVGRLVVEIGRQVALKNEPLEALKVLGEGYLATIHLKEEEI